MITTENHRFLLDCGQFQGSYVIDELNAKKIDFDPAETEFLILSHVHIDHSGRIPEQITEINNIIISLEKNTYSLGAIMSLKAGGSAD